MTQSFFKPRDLPDPLKWKENPTQLYFLPLSPKSKYSIVHSELPSIHWCSFQLIQPPAGTAAEERPVYVKNKTIWTELLQLVCPWASFSLSSLPKYDLFRLSYSSESLNGCQKARAYLWFEMSLFFFSPPLHHSCEKTGTTQDRMISLHNTVM